MESNHVENIRNWKTKQTTKRNSPSTNAYRLHGQLGYIMPLKRQASVYLYKRKQSNEMFWVWADGLHSEGISLVFPVWNIRSSLLHNATSYFTNTFT